MKPSDSAQKYRQLLELSNSLRWELGDDFQQQLMESIYGEASRISARSVHPSGKPGGFELDRAIDCIVTSRLWGLPLMLVLLTLVFWITVSGANLPSEWLSALLLEQVYPFLKTIAASLAMPWWLDGLLIDGMYLATAWVISVMLPPMAIFFPLFTLLEDFGYLPRVAFNLDHLFQKAGGHGKQALSMAMGFGCNAAGVIATRIIDSPRERLIAIVTNNFALCNGRWPTQILIATLFIGTLAPAFLAGLISALSVVSIAVLGVALTFLVSWLLSRTVLQGEVSTFNLELPPYRPPRFLSTIYTSLIDRTLYVLWRAVVFALPAGALIWLSANWKIGGTTVAGLLIEFLDPFGWLIGLNGVILLAYILAIPANEIVIPTILMLTVTTAGIEGVSSGAGVLFDLEANSGILEVFQSGGWTLLTGINLMLFSLIHNPCSTTLYTIYKETGSVRWTALSGFLPLGMGLLVVFLVTQIWRIVAG